MPARPSLAVTRQGPTQDPIERVRHFNRFYTRVLGLLDEGLLASPYSLTEARLLFEIAHGDGPSARDLAQGLGLDAGYLSRLLARLEADGLIARRADVDDARLRRLTLTAAGRAAQAPLEVASRAQLQALLGACPPERVAALLAAMHTIEQTLQGSGAVATVLRPLETGDLGWIIHRQARLYAAEYGWDQTYEALIAGICARYVEHFDPAGEHAWVAVQDGAIVGSVFVVRADPDVAQLRLLYVEPSARGQGVGALLTETCLAFARARGYRRMRLWTNDVLTDARRLYERAGFELIRREAHRSFGKDLVGEIWERDLSDGPR